MHVNELASSNCQEYISSEFISSNMTHEENTFQSLPYLPDESWHQTFAIEGALLART